MGERYKYINIIKKLFLLFALLLLNSCDTKLSGSYRGYKNFECKGKVVTSFYPMKLYIFRDYKKYGDFYSDTTPYFLDVIDWSSNFEDDSYTDVIKTYPAFEKFKILKFYGHCSIDAGCSDNYLVQNQNDGVYMWLSGSNFSSDFCQISSGDFELDEEQNASEPYDGQKNQKPYPKPSNKKLYSSNFIDKSSQFQ